MATKTPAANPAATPSIEQALEAFLAAATSVPPGKTIVVGSYRLVTSGAGELVELKRR